jgi:hypothetical protein
VEDGEKWHRQLFEPFPNQKISSEEAARMRQEELSQFAASFGVAPPPA